jgi:hypothetical protein
MKVEQLTNLMKTSGLNWLKTINDQLLNSSKLSDGDLILVENPEFLRRMSEVIAKTDNE